MTHPLVAEKRAARALACERRDRLRRAGFGRDRRVAGHVLHAIGELRDMRVVAGYLPMRTEIDPRPAMLALLGLRYRVCVPVIEGGAHRPLRFRDWTPRARLERGAFGVSHPVEGDWVEPDVILAPLLAFDAAGWRLGYGGGYYDRTLMALRAERPLAALGLAFAGQQVEAVPHGPDDQRLDGIVTEAGLIRLG